MINRSKKIAVVACAMVAAPAFAVPTSIFDLDKDAGAATFDATVTATGATVNVDVLSGLSAGSSFDRGAYTITTNDGTGTSVFSAATDASSGQMLGINPSAPGVSGIGGGLAPAQDFFDSGITFTFTSAINAIGFEVGDWGTCCQPSSLFIQFDGGILQTVGTATTFLGSTQSVFVSAIDDTDTFTSVSFWGDGIGEFLTAGGRIRYATVPEGSIGVPAPGSLLLLAMGLIGAGVARRK